MQVTEHKVNIPRPSGRGFFRIQALLVQKFFQVRTLKFLDTLHPSLACSTPACSAKGKQSRRPYSRGERTFSLIPTLSEWLENLHHISLPLLLAGLFDGRKANLGGSRPLLTCGHSEKPLYPLGTSIFRWSW